MNFSNQLKTSAEKEEEKKSEKVTDYQKSGCYSVYYIIVYVICSTRNVKTTIVRFTAINVQKKIPVFKSTFFFIDVY